MDPSWTHDGTTWMEMVSKMAPAAQSDAGWSHRWSNMPARGMQNRSACVSLDDFCLYVDFVFPMVVAWFVVPSDDQDEPRWAQREPNIAKESAKLAPR